MEIPIPTLHLFPQLDAKLAALLKELRPNEWQRPTLAKQWTVKDIAAHLLDGNMRSLSILRDNFSGDAPSEIRGYQDFVNYLNRLNADWVAAMKRVSPGLLIELLESTGKQYHQMLSEWDPFANAAWPVSWAGETVSANWFHIARDYTEKWHHQQQIREAVGKPGIMTREFYFPMMQTFMRALPHTWRNVSAPENTVVTIIVTGEAGGKWSIARNEGAWQPSSTSTVAAVEVTLSPETAWKLFTKGLTRDEARSQINFEGDEELGSPILSMLAVIA